MQKYLVHHGIMGMHWGERRFQNPDGSLTLLGKERYEKVSSNEKLSKKETKKALEVYKRNKKLHDVTVDSAKRKETRYLNKAYANKKLLNQEGKIDPNNKYVKKASKYASIAKTHIEASKTLSKSINDIETGKLKAGRDFITQTDYDFYALPIGLLTGGVVPINAYYVNSRTKVINK